MTRNQLKAKIKELVKVDREAERLAGDPKWIGTELVAQVQSKFDALWDEISTQIDEMYAGAADDEEFGPHREIRMPHGSSMDVIFPNGDLINMEVTPDFALAVDNTGKILYQADYLPAVTDLLDEENKVENLCQHCEQSLDNSSAAAVIWHHYRGCVDSKVDAEFEAISDAEYAAYYDTSRD